ncbi:MAG TPA: DUF2726 domain-containing protein [Chloroflexia bacterium]|nr:DUF2726 domain-containing protein [Chloroflexia bacterium]
MSPATKGPGCLLAFLRLFGLGRTAAKALPYRLSARFLSPAELAFFGVLREIAGSQFVICPKVGLSDLFFVPSGPSRQMFVNKINQKHVDFLLCDSATLRPVLGLELDDASHQRADRAARDEFVDQVFATAGLPLLHVPCQASYDSRVLAGQVAEAIATGMPSAPPKAATAGASGVPLCPACGVPMILRTAGRGARAGAQFYGCSNFPRCRETAAL